MTVLTKILVVDDEPLLQTLILQKFKPQMDAGTLAFTFAGNGIEALKKLDEDKEIGVVLTDIKMHQMDGLTLLHHLADQPRLFKIVVVSAYGDMSNIRRSMEDGASDFLLKPFDLRDLEAAIMNVVHQYQFVRRGVEAKNKVIELEKELKIAREIKRAFIPTDFEVAGKLKIDGKMIFSDTPGGDFFDFFPLGENKMGVVVASVNSKGIPAALHTAILQMLFRALPDSISSIHQYILDEMPSNTLAGFFYAICNTVTGEVEYYSTGKIFSYLISKGVVSTLQGEGHIRDFDKIIITTEMLDESTLKGDPSKVLERDIPLLTLYKEAP